MENKSAANSRSHQSGNRGRGRGPREVKPKEFDERVLEISRVTRVVKGGKRLKFRALVVIGDGAKHKVAYGLGKASDVTAAVQKAVSSAKKDWREATLKKGTLPYRVTGHFKSARVLIKPAKPGTGLIAGGPIRVVLELAGVKDAVAKMLGSSNKVSNVIATIDALSNIRSTETILSGRGISTRKTEPSTETEA